jgi:hypothetical protein
MRLGCRWCFYLVGSNGPTHLVMYGMSPGVHLCAGGSVPLLDWHERLVVWIQARKEIDRRE